VPSLAEYQSERPVALLPAAAGHHGGQKTASWPAAAPATLAGTGAPVDVRRG
jgi:hypothetical protein